MGKPRAYLTTKQKMEILAAQDFLCAGGCGRRYKLGRTFQGVPVEWDHRIPDALDKAGRKPDQAICEECHARKTKGDVKDIARAKRRAGEAGQRKRREARKAEGKHPIIKGKTEIEGRGFDKTLTRKFSGKVQRRKP